MKQGNSLIFILVFIILASSCGKNNESTQIVLTFLTREKGDGDQGRHWTENLKSFKEAYPGATIQDDSIGDEAALIIGLR